MAPLDDGPVAFRLAGRQQSVYASLAAKSLAMAALYESALRVLRDGSNSGRFFLASRGFPIPSVETRFEVVTEGRVHHVRGDRLRTWIENRRRELKGPRGHLFGQRPMIGA